MIEMLILMGVMILFFWFMSRGARKAQKTQMEQRAKAVELGNNVVTSSGFFGKIVDIDGDAVTLESPSGDETVWLKQYIVAQMDLPLATGAYGDDDAEPYGAESHPDVAEPSSAERNFEDRPDGLGINKDDEQGPEITNNSPFYDK